MKTLKFTVWNKYPRYDKRCCFVQFTLLLLRSCVLKLVRKSVEPNFTYLCYMVQDLDQWAKFHFYSIRERGCVKARFGGAWGTVWGATGGVRPPWALSLPPVLRPLGRRWACPCLWGPLMYIDSSAPCTCEIDPLTSKCLARCALLFLAASTGRTLSSGAFSGNSDQLWMEASSAGSWGGRSLGLPVLLSDSRLDAFPPVPVFIFQGFHNKVPQTECLKQQKLTFWQFWRLEVQEVQVVRVGFYWGLSPWLVDGRLLGLHVDWATFMSGFEFPLLVRTPVFLGQSPSYDLILT